MQIDPIFLHYIYTYFIIGIVIALISDICIYYTKSSEQYTFLEILGYILLWPIIILIVLVSLINKN